MQTVWQDLRYGTRLLLQKPGFTVVAVITLAFGIGVNTALFTGFNIFLRPKPIKDPDKVVRLEYQGQRPGRSFAYPDYVYLRSNAQAFAEVIANFEEKFLVGEKAQGVAPEEIIGNFISENYMGVLGGTPGLGRFFTPEECRVAGRDAVVILTDHFWKRRFGADPEIIGRQVLLNGKPFTVIGVTNPSFVGLRYDMPDIWLPLMMRPAVPTVYFEEVPPDQRDWMGSQKFRWLTLHARFAPGKTERDGRAELALLMSQMARANSAIDSQDTINVASISDLAGITEVWLLMAMVLGASALVLLIACSNIANMLLARAASRQKEIGIRLCLGAGRGRIVRQLLTESFLLALLGGSGGVLLAWWSLDLFLMSAIERYDSANPARLALNLSPDLRVLGFSIAITLISGVAFGLAPALRATSLDPISVIKDESSSLSGRVGRSRLRSGLVVAQIALCVLLLIPAGLLVRGVKHVLSEDPGYETSKLLQVAYSLELSDYPPDRARLFHQQLIERLASLPGVKSVSPTREFGGLAIVMIHDQSGANERQFNRVPFEFVTAGFLDTIGTPIVQGRRFTAEDESSKAPLVIVSETTARNAWPNDSALGKEIRVETRSRDGSTAVVFPSAKVIGVARDNQTYRVGQVPPFFFYAPQKPTGFMDTSLFVRTTDNAATMKDVIQAETFGLEPVLRLSVNSVDELIARDKGVLSSKAASELAAGLGALALLLAAIGVYGVMSFSVAQRTREIGIRMALGAETGDVLRMVLTQAMRLVLLGTLIGAIASIAATQIIKSMLFGLSPADPITYVAVTSLLSVVAMVACYLPARRATRVNPIEALRYE